MNIQKWIGLFIKTLILGGVVSLIVSFFIKSGEYTEFLKPFDFVNFSGVVIWYIIYGFLYSVISQTGFFAYLFVNQFGLSLFRSFWVPVQIVLIAFVLFDLVYFPYHGMNKEMSLYIFILMSLAILVYGLIIARIKAVQTHQRAFVPALFFMVVITAIEWVPGLRTGEVDFAAIMIITLLVCNTYQLLQLHKLTESAPQKNKGKANRAKVQKEPVKN